MPAPRDHIRFLDGWYFRPQKHVRDFSELCRPDGTVVCILPSDAASRLAAALVDRSGAKKPLRVPDTTE
jgi:hypothetical protein